MKRSLAMRSLGFGAAAVVLAFLGCGSSDDAGVGSSSWFSQEYCKLVQPCCQGAGLPDTMQSCRALTAFVPVVDTAAAQECIEAYRAMAAEPDWCTTLGGAQRPEACERAFPEETKPSGTRLPGQSCDTSDDCAPSIEGDVTCATAGGSDWICQLRRHGSAGEACVGTQDDNVLYLEGTADGSEISVCVRAEGFHCTEGTCQAVAPVGGDCDGYDQMGCEVGAYCSDPGVCKALVAAGGSCAGSWAACDEASYCDAATSLCVDRASNGSPCETSQQCESSYCPSEGFCEEFAMGGLGLLMLCP